MKKILFVSPHFDDTVYSCGALISHFTSQGYSCDVLVIFAGDHEDEISNFAEKMHKGWNIQGEIVNQRKLEDMKAVEFFGCKQLMMSFQDCIYRKRGNSFLINSKQDLFVKGYYDNDLSRSIQEEANHLFDRNKYDEVYLPFGIGDHIDHQIVSEIKIPSKGIKRYYYVDMPYAFFNIEETIGFLKKLKIEPITITDDCFSKHVSGIEIYKTQFEKNWKTIINKKNLMEILTSFFERVTMKRDTFFVISQ